MTRRHLVCPWNCRLLGLAGNEILLVTNNLSLCPPWTFLKSPFLLCRQRTGKKNLVDWKPIDPLPRDKTEDWSKVKKKTDNRLKLALWVKLMTERMENNVRKGEIIGDQPAISPFSIIFETLYCSWHFKLRIVFKRNGWDSFGAQFKLLLIKIQPFWSYTNCQIIAPSTVNDSATQWTISTQASQSTINPFPNKPWFLRVCSTSLLKTLLKKEKLLVTSNFSFSHRIFYPFEERSSIFIKFGNSFSLEECKICRLGKG